MSNLIMYPNILLKSAIRGSIALLGLLAVYFLVLTLVSGWKFTWEQFTRFWYYIILLASGFGVQFGLYSYLKGIVKQQTLTGQVLAATGATSTTAMISCCAHYLTNILPILGVTGIITFIGQYQVQFFWIGLFFNLLGILYTGNKINFLLRNTVIFNTKYQALLITILLVILTSEIKNVGGVSERRFKWNL